MASISLREAIVRARAGDFLPELWEVKQLLDMLGFKGERTRLMARKALANYSEIKNHGIYSRVVWNYPRCAWEYHDGQDGVAERKVVRELLVKAGEQFR